MRYFDFIQETTTSTPTGAIGQTVSLAAVTGYGRFSDITPGTDEEFCVSFQSGNNKEVGIWAYTDTNELTRKLVYMKIDSGTYYHGPTTGIALSGTTTVTLTNGAVMQAASAFYSGANSKLLFPIDEPRPSTTAALTTNRVYAHPITVRAPVMAAGMHSHVSTAAGTTGTLNMAIYTAGCYGGPCSKIAEITTPVSVMSTGLKQPTFTSNVYLSPGVYFALGICDFTGTAPQVRGHGAGLSNFNLLGSNSSTDNNASTDFLYQAGSGTTLAASYTGGWTGNHSSAGPYFGIVYA